MSCLSQVQLCAGRRSSCAPSLFIFGQLFVFCFILLRRGDDTHAELGARVDTPFKTLQSTPDCAPAAGNRPHPGRHSLLRLNCGLSIKRNLKSVLWRELSQRCFVGFRWTILKKINLFNGFNTLRLPPKIPQIKNYVEDFSAATSQFQMLDNQDEDVP